MTSRLTTFHVEIGSVTEKYILDDYFFLLHSEHTNTTNLVTFVDEPVVVTSSSAVAHKSNNVTSTLE